MSKFLAGKPGISVLLAVFLGLALSACSSGVSQSKLDDANKQIADRERQEQQMAQQRTAAQNALASAGMLVNALTANSTAAQVQAAQAAVTAAANAVAAASSLSETERNGLTIQLNGIRANLTSVTAMRDAAMQQMAAQKTAAENALNAAQMAVDALNDSSTDAQVMAAADALAAASAAITAATSLSAAEMEALRNRLAMITTARDNRVGNRQMASQRMAANDALNTANTAVNGVTNGSSDADVQAADEAVAAAASAVAAATSLSAADMQALNDRLATIRSNLASAKYRRQVAMEDQQREEQNTEMANQRMAAQNALNAARTAVNALMANSSDADAAAAAGLISAAETAVNAATSLSQSEQAGLRTQLANIETTLARTNTMRSDLMTARTATNTAATDAGTAATDAEKDAKAAETAGMNLATVQTADQKKAPADYKAADSTSLSSRFHAAQAREHATMARKYAGMAGDEKTNADNAMSAAAAQAAQRAAEAAKMKADEYRTKAMQEMDKAVAAAKMEVKVDGLTFSVGDTSIVYGSDYVSTGTTRTGRTRSGATGFPGTVRATNKAVRGVPGQSSGGVINQKYQQAVEGGVFHNAGHRNDSPDDKSRLTLVTGYMRGVTAKVAVNKTGSGIDFVGEDQNDANPHGQIRVGGTSSLPSGTETSTVTIHGMYYMAEDCTPNGSTCAGFAGTKNGILDHVDLVWGFPLNRGPAVIYTFTFKKPADTTPTRVYMRRHLTVFNEGGIGRDAIARYEYKAVDIDANHDGDNNTPDQEITFTAPGPYNDATPYSHVNFGMWNELDKAGVADASQMPANLGVAFLQKTKDGKRTGSDMRNFGSATYRGNWVANIRAAAANGKGDITARDGAALLQANFGSGTVTATLTNLATLSGKISGDTFSGNSATAHGLVTGGTYAGHLPSGKSYSGDLMGHFYGPKSVEAAAIFDFTSAGAKDGEFRGAFGGSVNGLVQRDQ